MPVTPGRVFHLDSQSVLEKVEQARCRKELVQHTFGHTRVTIEAVIHLIPHFSRPEPWEFDGRQNSRSRRCHNSCGARQAPRCTQLAHSRSPVKDAPQRKWNHRGSGTTGAQVPWRNSMAILEELPESVPINAWTIFFILLYKAKHISSSLLGWCHTLQAVGIKILPYLEDWLICAPGLERYRAYYQPYKKPWGLHESRKEQGRTTATGSICRLFLNTVTVTAHFHKG